MSIFPASRLSSSDLSHLGNNLRGDGLRKAANASSAAVWSRR